MSKAARRQYSGADSTWRCSSVRRSVARLCRSFSSSSSLACNFLVLPDIKATAIRRRGPHCRLMVQLLPAESDEAIGSSSSSNWLGSRALNGRPSKALLLLLLAMTTAICVKLPVLIILPPACLPARGQATSTRLCVVHPSLASPHIQPHRSAQTNLMFN